MESGGNNRSPSRGGDRSSSSGTGSSSNNKNNSRGSASGASSSRSGVSGSGSSGRCSAVGATGSIIVATSGAGGVVAAPPTASEWEMFQFGKYPMEILEMLSGHQAHQFKGLGLERQLPHQQQVQLHQHQQQLQQQQQGETSGTLLSGIGLGSLQSSRSNSFADSSSIFAKMSAPLPPLQQQTPSTSSQSSRKSSKMGASSASGSGGSMTGYPQFLRSFHPTEAALAQEQLHPGMGRFEHFTGGSVAGGAGVIGGVVTSAPPAPPPPLHPGIAVPQASPGPSSSSPSPSSSTSTSNNPPSSSAVASLGQQPVASQSDARSLHQQFSCMLAANQYFLSGVPANTSLEQFLVQQGTHNHLSLGLGQGSADSNSALAPPPALHPSHTHGHSAPQQQQQQQLPPHALPHPHSHPHAHHPLHPAPQPSTLGGFDFQGIPVLSSNQLASLMQQETGLPLPLPLHLSLSKDEGKTDGGTGTGGSGGGGRRKKAMAGYLPQRKPESSNNSSNCHGSGDPSTSNSSGGHSHNASSSLVGEGVVGLSSLEDHSSLLNSPPSSSSSSVSSTLSSATSSTSASVLVTNGSQIPKIETLGPVAPTATQPEPEPLYHCGECGKTFTHLSSLRRHLRSHGLATGGGINSNSGANPNSSHNHQHQPEPSLPHSTQDVISQSNPHHQQRQQQVSVNLQQSNSTPTSSSLCPSPEKTHCCPDCGKRFKKRGHLLQHGVIHSGERPFSCTICQRSFNRRESLTRHEKIHEDKPFRCPACGRCFRESTSLLNHAASGTCGRPGRASRSRGSNSGTSSSLAVGGSESFQLKTTKTGAGAVDGTGMIAGGSEVGEYQGGQLASEAVIYGKAEEEVGEERRVVECMMGVNEEEKTGLPCGGLFQQERGGSTNSGSKGDTKYGTDFPRSRYQVPYRTDEYRGDYKQHRSQATSTCYPGESSCGNVMPGPALRKAPLAPTLHPHPQNQTQQQQHQQQPHLPLSSLLDDSEDDVSSSVSNAMSAIAAAAVASCIPNEHSNVGVREERRDIIGGLLGGLGFGALGVSPGGPSSISGIDKTYRGSGNECMSNTMLSLTPQSQQHLPHQQTRNAKPKRPRKPRAKKEPVPGDGAGGEGIKRKRHTQSGGGARGEGKERPYLCSVCGRGFSRRETLRRHDRIHTGEKPHHCAVCGKNFREAFHLTKHHTVHSGEKNYKCDICGKDFGYAQSLKRHGKLHQKDFGDEVATTGVTNSAASASGGGSSQDCNPGNSDSYYSYSQDKAQGSSTQPPPRLYTCAVCWKSFRHHFHLTAHHQAVHGSGEKLFSCEVCGKAFAYANSLTRHRLSQHGLTRTGQVNPTTGASGSRASANRTVSESEIATNTLLQLVPGSGTHGIHHTHMGVPHPQHHPPPSTSSLSPLFYLPETVASTTSSPSHSHILHNHCPVNHNHQHPATAKGEPIYQSASASLVSSTPSLFLPNSQPQHHPQQLATDVKSLSTNRQCHSSLEMARKHKTKKRKHKQGGQDLSLTRNENKLRDPGRFMAAEGRFQNENGKQRKGKTNHQRALKKKLAQLLKTKGGGKFWRAGGLSLGYLPSSAVPQKRFSCPYCPSATFSRQSALLVHCAARHPPKTVSHHTRRECSVCGKRSRKLYGALCHRGFHLAQGTFSCPRCLCRFWNEALLKRHNFACRGVGKEGGYGDLKMLSLIETSEKKGEEGLNNQMPVLTDSRL